MVAVSTPCEKFEKIKSLWSRNFLWLSRKDTDVVRWRGQCSCKVISHCRHDWKPGVVHLHIKISFLSTTFSSLITGKFKLFNVDCKEQEDWKFALLFPREQHEVMGCRRLVLCTLLLRPVVTPASIRDLLLTSWIVNPITLVPCDCSKWEDILVVTATLLSLLIWSSVAQVVTCSVKNRSWKLWFASMVIDNAREILNT